MTSVYTATAAGTYSPCSNSPSPVSSSASSPRSVSFTHTPTKEGFALANVRGSIHLVQVQTAHPINCSNDALLDVKIFRHEFISIFRLSHAELIQPADIRILESIDEQYAVYQEENDTVFLAKELSERLHQMMNRRSSRGASQRHFRHSSLPMGVPRGQRANVYR